MQKRGGKGAKNYRIMPKTGDVVGMLVVSDQDEIIGISEKGKVIRFDINNVNVKKSKNVTGVILQNLDEGDRTASVALVRNNLEDEKTE